MEPTFAFQHDEAGIRQALIADADAFSRRMNQAGSLPNGQAFVAHITESRNVVISTLAGDSIVPGAAVWLGRHPLSADELRDTAPDKETEWLRATNY